MKFEILKTLEHLTRVVEPTTDASDNGTAYFIEDKNKAYILLDRQNKFYAPIGDDIKSVIYFAGDSQTLNGVDILYKGAESTNYGGIAASLIGTEWAARTETTGTLEYRAVDKAFRWTIAGDTAGAWTPIVRAGRYVFPSGTANKGVAISIRSFSTLPTDNKTIAVTLSGQMQTRINPSGSPTTQGHVMGYFGLPYHALGASGARTSEFVEYMDWLKDQMPDRGVVVIRIGTNDIGAGIATSTIIANAYQAFDTLRRRGHKLCICAIAPRWQNNLVGTALTFSQYDSLHKVNAAYEAYCQDHASDCQYVDCFTPSVDTDYDDARPRPNTLVDYVHDGYESAINVANEMITAISRWIQPFHVKHGDTSILNGATAWVKGTGGTIGANSTGIAPNGWTVSTNSAEVTTVNSVGLKDGKRTFTCEITANTTATRDVNIVLTLLNDLTTVKGGRVYFDADITLSYTGVKPIVNPSLYVNGALIRTDVYIERVDEVSRRVSYFVEVPDVSSYISPSIKVTVGVGVSNVTLDVKNFIVRKGV